MLRVEEEEQRLWPVLEQLAQRLQDNYPYAHPLYVGQMLKPPHAIARLAYMLALYINPNNHALDGGRASSALEKEAIATMAQSLLGWEHCLGHLTSSGTIANLEALWVASRLAPGKKILASAQAHYTHSRLSEVLGLGFEAIPCDADLRMDLQALERRLQQDDQVGAVVATLGTTGAGAVDPLPQLLALRQKYGFRLHVDAAYGGYFGLMPNLAPQEAEAFAALGQADSVVIDPHKQGLQPYGCGAVFFKDPSVGRFYKHDSPYTYFSSADLHLGEISLECSRAGAAAVALWATLQAFPLVKGGDFAQRLALSRQAALDFYAYLQASPHWLCFFEPSTDIVLWSAKGKSLSEISRRNAELFEQAAQHNLHLALFRIPRLALQGRAQWQDVELDQDALTCLRSCWMKPEHVQGLPWIKAVLEGLV